MVCPITAITLEQVLLRIDLFFNPEHGTCTSRILTITGTKGMSGFFEIHLLSCVKLRFCRSKSFVIRTAASTTGYIIQFVIGKFTALGIELCKVGLCIVLGNFNTVCLCKFKELLGGLCCFCFFNQFRFHSATSRFFHRYIRTKSGFVRDSIFFYTSSRCLATS